MNIFELKEENIRKFNLTDEDGDSERPWFWVDPKDITDYDRDVRDDTIRIGVAANGCLAGLPWGALFPYKLNGSIVPTVNMKDIIKWSNDKVIYHPECLEKIKQAQEKSV